MIAHRPDGSTNFFSFPEPCSGHPLRFLDRDSRFVIRPSPDLNKPSTVVRDFPSFQTIDIQGVLFWQNPTDCTYFAQELDAFLPESVHHIPSPHILADSMSTNGKSWTLNQKRTYLTENVDYALELLFVEPKDLLHLCFRRQYCIQHCVEMRWG